ncbi:NfeD family protein [Leadbetterella byssophila]|uniref:NfeD family protein n=1 Tax=Leadbetterella byssophila TaxID=316068 RepID=UPI0039A2E145
MEPISFWVVIGIALLIVEILSVSFYSIFFGIGGLVTALFVYIGLADEISAQLLVFGIASMASLFIFRKKLVELFDKNAKDFKEIVDDFAKVSSPIPPHGEGKVYYRGADWIAYSDSEHSIDKDARVKIRKIDGIKLIVEPA